MIELISYGRYLFFAASVPITFTFTGFIISETKGKSLKEMNAVLGDTTAHEEKTRLYTIAASLGHEEVEAAVDDKKLEKLETTKI
jgi:hypothetical protein